MYVREGPMNIMSISKNNNVKRKSIRLFCSLPLFPSHLMSDYGDEHPILLVFCLAVVSLSREIVEFPLVVCLFPGIVTNYFYYTLPVVASFVHGRVIETCSGLSLFSGFCFFLLSIVHTRSNTYPVLFHIVIVCKVS